MSFSYRTLTDCDPSFGVEVDKATIHQCKAWQGTEI